MLPHLRAQVRAWQLLPLIETESPPIPASAVVAAVFYCVGRLLF